MPAIDRAQWLADSQGPRRFLQPLELPSWGCLPGWDHETLPRRMLRPSQVCLLPFSPHRVLQGLQPRVTEQSLHLFGSLSSCLCWQWRFQPHFLPLTLKKSLVEFEP